MSLWLADLNDLLQSYYIFCWAPSAPSDHTKQSSSGLQHRRHEPLDGFQPLHRLRQLSPERALLPVATAFTLYLHAGPEGSRELASAAQHRHKLL